jgi:hypothetical protein
MIVKIPKCDKALEEVLEREQAHTKHCGHEIELEYNHPIDLFDIGVLVGKERHGEKEQSFQMHCEYAEILQQAIEEAENEMMVRNQTIEICEDVHGKSDMRTIRIRPTTIIFLFICFKNYGRIICHKKKH